MSIATELTALSGHITNAYNAVNTKGGTIPTNKNMANLDDAILSIPSGGQITNGTVAQYKSASGTIPKDTFVEFTDIENAPSAVFNQASMSFYDSNGPLTAPASQSNESVDAVALGDNKCATVFLATPDGETNKYFYAMVYTVGENGVTTGTAVRLPGLTWTGTYATGMYAAIDAISPNKVIIAYAAANATSGTDKNTRVIIGNISGNTITLGTETVTTASTGYVHSIVALSSSKAVAIIGDQYSVCTIANDVITASTPSQIDGNDAIYVFSSTLSVVTRRLSEDKFFFMDANAQAVICTVSGDSLKLGIPTVVMPQFYSGGSRLVGLTFIDSSTFVFAGRSSGGSDPQTFRAVVGRISGDAISVGAVNTFSSSTLSMNTVANALPDGRIFFVYFVVSGGSGNPYLYAALGEVDGDTVTLSGSTQINYTLVVGGTGSTRAGMLLNNGDIFFAQTCVSSTASTGNALILRPLSFTRKIIASQTQINGVTIDDITTSTAGDVWTFAGDTTFNGDADIRRF